MANCSFSNGGFTYDNISWKACNFSRATIANWGNSARFHPNDNRFGTKSLSDFAGKKKVISVIPSIDTGICSTQTRTFNKELSDMEDTVVITVSADLPFAQARWCGVEGLERAVMMSDYYDNTFGKTYGLLMQEWHLLARAVLI